MASSSSSAGVEGQQQQQLPSGDHDRAAANVEEGLARQLAIVKYFNEIQKAAVEGQWETGRTILGRLFKLDVDPGIHSLVVSIQIVIANISIQGGKRTIDFFTKLVRYLPDDSLLSTVDPFGRTLLHYAGMTGNKAAALVLVERVPNLLNIVDKEYYLPVMTAARCSHRGTVEYLMSVTSWDVANIPFGDGRGQLGLFVLVIKAEFFDIAMDLVEKYPQIATAKLSANVTALGLIAEVASKYSADSRRRGFSNWPECLLSTFPQMRGIDGNYLKRQQILEIVKCLCIAQESSLENFQICIDAILTAARFGSHKVIEVIAETSPKTIMTTEPNTNRDIFQLAIEHRHEKVFKLIYRVGGLRYSIASGVDSEGNNILHSAAKLAPVHKLNQISGAALQMQYEIQWYKEVEKLLSPADRYRENNNNKSPGILFTEEHQKLKDDGEKWMKQTAESCSIVAALIITIMFTAAITVPGGNESNSGFPMFRGEKAFIVFAIADAISLFTSTTSLLIFLSILTSRFPEESFLYYHPTQLIFGLGTLFLSIASMMIAFTATTFLVLGRKEAWMLIPTTAFASLGIASFAFLQFPLICGLISSTFGPGIFNKKSGKPLM